MHDILEYDILKTPLLYINMGLHTQVDAVNSVIGRKTEYIMPYR